MGQRDHAQFLLECLQCCSATRPGKHGGRVPAFMEIALLFGMNQSSVPDQNEMTIQLSDRIVMSPFVAKRLAGLLDAAIKDYESKYGILAI